MPVMTKKPTKKSLTRKILEAHLVEGPLKSGEEIGIKIDQTLTQDATGTLAYLQFESLGISRVKTKCSVSYVDHNTLQSGFENADDHRFLQSVAQKYGVYFSRPGNGICHQVHRERFSVPGQTLLGSDSHTPTCGGVGMLAIGSGGLDVAVAMAGKPYYMSMPQIVGVHLAGKIQLGVSGKDLILELLRRLTVKWGRGKILEYFGPGVSSLSVSDRFTISNMGAELGLTTSIFPSDKGTREFFKAQGRPQDWREVGPDKDAQYDEVIELNLTTLEPMIACPHSPDNVVPVSKVAGRETQQVCIGSCTNSSFYDMSIAAEILKGKTVHPRVSMAVTPGSRQVFQMMAKTGVLEELIRAGGRILESACGPCIGMGQAPASGSTSVRTFNRNFEGRAGTKDAFVYLASPAVCAATALTGVITDPRTLNLKKIKIQEPKTYSHDDGMIVSPGKKGTSTDVIRGPNIKPMPIFDPLPDQITKKVLIKVGDDITTDHIMPAGAKVLPLRSNVPGISNFVFVRVDEEFPKRCKDWQGGVIVGGSNYGQGSSREHAAVAPRYLGVAAVLVKSFARIHLANLINFGILPLTFANEKNYDKMAQGDELVIEDIRRQVKDGDFVMVTNKTRGIKIKATFHLTARQRAILLAGGLLNYVKKDAA